MPATSCYGSASVPMDCIATDTIGWKFGHSSGVDSCAAFILQLGVVPGALFAALPRRQKPLFACSICVFFPLGLYALTGEGFAQCIGLLSLICLVLAAAIFWQHGKSR